MLEDFRKSANKNSGVEEDPIKDFDPYDYSEHDEEQIRKQFLGMTSAQRFILSLMLLIMTFILAVLILVLTGKIYLPIF